jgi:fatty-acyl-CoA synthase
MARFKVPKRVIFCTLPKTSTGKIQKYVLRETTSQDEPYVVRSDQRMASPR